MDSCLLFGTESLEPTSHRQMNKCIPLLFKTFFQDILFIIKHIHTSCVFSCCIPEISREERVEI